MWNHEALQIERLIRRAQEVVRSRDSKVITDGIKAELETLIKTGCICLPDECMKPVDGGYARRLVYEDKDLGFVMVAMTWGVGQGTPIHDHAGIWCVEGVISGEIEVLSYEMMEDRNERCRLREIGRIHSQTGGAGALIPPYEYHIIRNALPDRPSVTLHIYGGDIKTCGIYVPETGTAPGQDGAWCRRETAQLKYVI